MVTKETSDYNLVREKQRRVIRPPLMHLASKWEWKWWAKLLSRSYEL